MRPLVIDEGAKLAVKQVLNYAVDHPYEPPDQPPGDNPNHVCHLNTYRCVFSFTKVGGVIYRDLSVSVPAQGKYPNPYAVYAIAELFGFTGWNGQTVEPPPAGWLMAKDVDVEAARIVQRIEQI